MGNFLLLIVTLLKIVPIVLEMIRDNKIREGTTDEVLRAFEEEFNKRWSERIERARAAGNVANTGGVRDNSDDPLDRANQRKKGGAKSGE